MSILYRRLSLLFVILSMGRHCYKTNVGFIGAAFYPFYRFCVCVCVILRISRGGGFIKKSLYDNVIDVAAIANSILQRQVSKQQVKLGVTTAHWQQELINSLSRLLQKTRPAVDFVNILTYKNWLVHVPHIRDSPHCIDPY